MLLLWWFSCHLTWWCYRPCSTGMLHAPEACHALCYHKIDPILLLSQLSSDIFILHTSGRVTPLDDRQYSFDEFYDKTPRCFSCFMGERFLFWIPVFMASSGSKVSVLFPFIFIRRWDILTSRIFHYAIKLFSYFSSFHRAIQQNLDFLLNLSKRHSNFSQHSCCQKLSASHDYCVKSSQEVLV